MIVRRDIDRSAENMVKWIGEKTIINFMKRNLFAFLICVITLPCFAGSFTDSRDGKTYKTVEIGEQTWMAENLNYETGKSLCYKNNASNCQKYGRLYDWKTAMKACPAGWHLPSKIDFEKLQLAVGGESVAGKKLKSRNGWLKEGNGSDSFGFTALPAGNHELSDFYDEGYDADFWSSTESAENDAYSLNLQCHHESDFLIRYEKDTGLSVRCLKD